MLDRAELIYKGRVGSKDKNSVDVYLSGTWIILADASKNKVITLYKVDFNVGEDFNKQYIQRMLKKLEVHKNELKKKKDQIATQRSDYLKIIQENESQMNEFRASIRNLEKLNADYKEIIDTMDAECSFFEQAVRQDIEDLMGSTERRADRCG